MTPQWKRSLWATGAIVGAAALFFGGVWVGTYVEHQRFEVAKLLSVVVADDYLADGKPDKALNALHFAKAYEHLHGDTDAMLAKAYLADGEPCLAQAFAESHLRYMERNKLTELAGYDASRDVRQRASVKCDETKVANPSGSVDAKPQP